VGVRALQADAAGCGSEFLEGCVPLGVGLLGFFGAWFVERKHIRFDPAKLGGYRVLAVAVGVLVLSLMIGNLPRLLAPFLGLEMASYVAAAANPIWIFVVWPFLLRGLEKPAPR
jgi:hypothetical protein